MDNLSVAIVIHIYDNGDYSFWDPDNCWSQKDANKIQQLIKKAGVKKPVPLSDAQKNETIKTVFKSAIPDDCMVAGILWQDTDGNYFVQNFNLGRTEAQQALSDALDANVFMKYDTEGCSERDVSNMPLQEILAA